MNKFDKIRDEFRCNRIHDESIPSDISILLEYSDELIERTGYSLSWLKDWKPWLDTSYLSEDELKDPQMIASITSISDISQKISFIASNEDAEFIGFWRGDLSIPISESPFVILDNEGQYYLFGSSRFCEVLLERETYDEDDYTELRNWFEIIGIQDIPVNRPEYNEPNISPTPNELCDELFEKYCSDLSS